MTLIQKPDLQPPSATVMPSDKRPVNETFTLPDLTPINVTEIKDQKITISIGKTPKDFRIPASKKDQEKDLEVIVEFVPLEERKAKVNLHGVVKKLQIWKLETFDSKLSFQDIWCAIYGFWICRNHQYDRFPIQVGSEFSNQEKVYKYLLFSGLAFHDFDSDATDEKFQVILDRCSFWQGAGAPLDLSWIRSPQPHPAVVGNLMSTSFPYIQSFTKSVNTTHPLRPSKPPAGAIIYSRYLHTVGAHLQFFHIDPSNEEHFDKFSTWMNSDRINAEWKEKGDKEHHRSLLKGRMEDPHIVCCISTWDGEYAGYGELSWSKEDGASNSAGALGDYDQGMHSLVGEDKFQESDQLAHTITSMKHFCFLREARTDIVISETQSDLSGVGKKATSSKLQRNDFFTETIFC